jgi:hypothetical protein
MTLKKLTVITLACANLFVSSAFASNDYQLSCNVNISSDILFANKELIVKSSEQEAILFKANGAVYVNDRKITLTKNEQKLAQRYYKDVEASVPMVVDIAVEILKITDLALKEVFSGLLGKNSSLPEKLNARINGVTTTLKDHVYQDPNSLTFDSAHLKRNLGLGNELTKEIEQIKAEIVSTLMGQLMVAIGQSMMNGGGDFTALESRMANLAKDIEKKAKTLGDSVKESAAALCDKIEALSKTEKELRKVYELRYLDTVYFTKKA